MVAQGEYQWVLDMSRLGYRSSERLYVVMLLARRLKQSAGRLVLCGLQPHRS
ncbi:hypothetical protein H0A66_10190 [Alcaligenaceae bacterium]|nr:hypothetical protein [Alcaligenaceae bacterium]